MGSALLRRYLPGMPLLRRVLATVIVVGQLALIVAAYPADHPVFGFQMFPESSYWQADIYRITPEGARIDVRHDWPGGYRWNDLAPMRGLANPFTRSHADTGLDTQVDFFTHALQWAADNTPLDTESVALEADVTVWFNDDPPRTFTVRTRDREIP
jgi:hypothetical protein